MELYHYGIKEQRWGVRRYQNKDGSRTPEGKQREADKRHAKRAEHYQQLKEELSKQGKTLADYRREVRSTRKAIRFANAVKNDKMNPSELVSKFGESYVKKQIENPEFTSEKSTILKSLTDDAFYEEYYSEGGDNNEQ